MNLNNNPNIDVNFNTEHDALENVTSVQLSITIRSAAQAAVDASNIEGANGVKVTYPHPETGEKVVESFAGPDSPELFQVNPESGRSEERPLPPQAEVEVVRTARGAWRRS